MLKRTNKSRKRGNRMEIKTLISQEDLQKRILQLAKKIKEDYQGREITILCILKGAAPFTMELIQHMDCKMTLEFMQLSSYLGKESTGKITVKKQIEENLIKDKNILIVEDIVDTGRSMAFMRKYLQQKGAKDIKICTLLNKKERRIEQVPIDYIGFEIEDKFVLGYGLDYDEYYRNLPYIGYVEE